MSRWHVASKSECSAQCGLGYRTLDIHCAKYSRMDGKTEKVDDSFCSSQPRPSNQEKCSGECSTGGWRYSAWTEVSWFSSESPEYQVWWVIIAPSGTVLRNPFKLHRERSAIDLRCLLSQALKGRLPRLICNVGLEYNMKKKLDLGMVGHLFLKGWKKQHSFDFKQSL